jgi:hypothetical protein
MVLKNTVGVKTGKSRIFVHLQDISLVPGFAQAYTDYVQAADVPISAPIETRISQPIRASRRPEFRWC